MPNILIHPNSGLIEFSTGVAGGDAFNSNFTGGALATRLNYDNYGGLNITSYVSNTSGLDRFSIDGANGRLFSVTDSLSGLLFSVNDIAGLPIIEAFDNDTVILGEFNRNDFIVTGNSVGIGAIPNTGTSKLYISGGNLRVDGGIFLSGNAVLTGVNLSEYITTGQTGAFYPASNPSGFVTGVDTSNFYTKDNPSGFITGVDLSALYPNNNPSGYITISSLSKIIDKFTPSQNQPPSIGFAQFDTRNSILVLDFDDTLTESGTFIGAIPDNTNLSNGLQVRINWTATSATAGSCVWGAQFMNLNTGLDVDSFDIAGIGSGVANATNGVPTVTEIICTGINGLTTGSFYRMLVYRNSADTTNDTMVGDAELVAVEVRSAA